MNVNTATIPDAPQSDEGRPVLGPKRARSSGSPAGPTIVITPPRGWISLNPRELWQYRDLLTLMVWRDISSRYRQSLIGYGWAVLKPVLSMLIFTFIFGRVANFPSDGAPYAIFSFAALLPWMYFSGALSGVTNSVVSSQQLLTKVYFPRLVLPLANAAVGLAELAVQAVVLALLMVWYRFSPGWQILCVPAFVVMSVVVSLAFGLWLTALNVKYRDVGQIVPFLLQAWMWLCPIVYSSSMIPPKWRLLYGFNPMVGVIEGFRWSILGTSTPDWAMMAVSFSVVAAILVSGLYYFRKAETTFADII